MHKFDRPKPQKVLFTNFTSGSRGFLVDLRERIEKCTDVIGGGICYHERAFRLSYSTSSSLKLYRFMYYDSKALYLERKKEVFEAFASIANLSTKDGRVV